MRRVLGGIYSGYVFANDAVFMGFTYSQDDLWRRNHDTISGLELHAVDFNPYYPTSIAYTPLPRAALETFLTQRGLLSKSPRWGDFFHPGFLNKLYLRLNETVFRGSSRVSFVLDLLCSFSWFFRPFCSTLGKTTPSWIWKM